MTTPLSKKHSMFREFLSKNGFVGFTGKEITLRKNKSGIYKKTNAITKKHSLITMENYNKFISQADKTFCVITGEKSDLVVFDFDTPTSYDIFVKQFPECKSYLTIKTNNGYHIYFKYHKDFPTLATNHSSNVDIRSNEGLVYAYPTEYIHPEKGVVKYEIYIDGIRGTITPEMTTYYNTELKDNTKQSQNTTKNTKKRKLDTTDTSSQLLNRFITFILVCSLAFYVKV